MSTETATTEKVKLSPRERAQAAADKAAAKVETAQAKVDKAKAKADDAATAHQNAVEALRFAQREAQYRANHPLLAPAAAPVEDEQEESDGLDTSGPDALVDVREVDAPFDQEAGEKSDGADEPDEFNPFA